MSQILLLQSSLNGPASRTNQLMERFLQTRREQGHQDQVVVRDLTALALPSWTARCFTPCAAEPANEAIRQAVALSDRLIAELKAADLLLIGAPCTTSTCRPLKNWFDLVARAG
jgi:FMN-dependent NADH-azoreductase